MSALRQMFSDLARVQQDAAEIERAAREAVGAAAPPALPPLRSCVVEPEVIQETRVSARHLWVFKAALKHAEDIAGAFPTTHWTDDAPAEGELIITVAVARRTGTA